MPLNPMGNAGSPGGEQTFTQFIRIVENIADSKAEFERLTTLKRDANKLIAEANELVKTVNASEAALNDRATEIAAVASRAELDLNRRRGEIEAKEAEQAAKGVALGEQETQYRAANAALEDEREALKAAQDKANADMGEAARVQKNAEAAQKEAQRKSDELDTKLAQLRAITEK